MWSKVVDLSFLACFFLFARAFLFYDFAPLGLATITTGHLPGSPNLINADATLYNGSTPPSSGLYHDALPPSWVPAMATNFTTNGDELPMELEGGSHALAQNSERHVPSSSAAESSDADADDGYAPDKELVLTRAAPRMETSSTPPVLFPSSNTRDRDLAAIERVTARKWHDSDYYGRDDYVVSNMDSDPQAYAVQTNSVQTITAKSRLSLPSDDDQGSLDDEPFLSMEEYDGEREIFALKIWIDKKELQRARLGKTRYCQASSGIKCLSDS